MPFETSKPPPKGFASFMRAMSKEDEPPQAETASLWARAFPPKKPDSADYKEAGVMPRMLFGKGNPLRLNREDRNAILAAMPWEKIRDEFTVPAMKEMEKGTRELKDSTNAYMHKLTTIPEWLIEDAVANGLRKLGK